MPHQIARLRSDADLIRPARAVPYGHPDRLASIARLFGMEPPGVDRCRVLELGSGSGGNLLPMAVRYPGSRFVGVDGAVAALAQAQQAAAALDIANAEFHHLSLAEIDDRLGSFDYIICHDLFSRVATPQQAELLAAPRARLNPQGVMYVGYRTLPGWLVPGIVRDVAQGHAHETDPLPQRLAAARQVLRFVSDALPTEPHGYERLLQTEADMTLRLPDAALANEYVARESHPLYFHEFAQLAGTSGLQYLGDGDISSMFAAPLGPTAEANLLQIARDVTSLEQSMDLLCNRDWRHSLLCQRQVTLTRTWTPARLAGLQLAGHVHTEQDDAALLTDEAARFIAADGRTFGASQPAVKVALARLGRLWPGSIAVNDLYDEVAAHLAREAPDGSAGAAAAPAFDREQLGQTLIECLANGFIEPRSGPDQFTTTISERPCACAWARAEAEHSSEVTTRRHEPLVLDEMSLNLLRYLDGNRDRAALHALLVEAADRGALSILRSGIPASQGSSLNEILDQVLDQSLAKLARSALLIA
ncbi:MAG: methyltransferase regulatory domain-containing protein [Pirellulales bacterium]